MLPENPRHTYRSWALAAILPLLMAGCAATELQTAPEQEPLSPAMQQIAERLPGHYISVGAEDSPTQSLKIERRATPGAGGLAMSMTQGDVGDDSPRHYGLKLRPTSAKNRLTGSFALLDEHGTERRSCPMRFHLGAEGLVGETNPQTCRFDQGSEPVGLLKEIAFDGRRISIGDRLVDPDSGKPRENDRIIRFLPAPTFTGWLGVREGDEWRVAQAFRLRAGRRIEPVDAAEMGLGVAVEINYYRMERNDVDVLMRLTLTDTQTGETIAESWAEPGSRTIGLALPDLQIGLSIPGRR